MKANNTLPALVVGLCSHGLTIARSLYRSGVNVYALEKNKQIFGIHTRCAKVCFVDDINGRGLIQALLDFPRQSNINGQIVLFLTNDKMVEIVAQNCSTLKDKYLIAWKGSSDTIMDLADKKNLDVFCRNNSFNYPESFTFESFSDLERWTPVIDFPVIVKPTKPLSRFKVLLIDDLSALLSSLSEYRSEFPVVVQRWIPGNDLSLYFYATYLEKGKSLASIVGQKLKASPPALGQAVAARCVDNPAIEALGEKFFEKTDLCGPAALEIKIDGKGVFWVVEPNVGRTEFLLSCCIKNGFDIPLFQYEYLTNKSIMKTSATDKYVWFDTEKDPLVFFKSILEFKLLPPRCLPIFPFLSHSDLLPFFFSLKKFTYRSYFYFKKKLLRD